MGYLINPQGTAGTFISVFSNAQNACFNPVFNYGNFSQLSNIVTVSMFGIVDLDFSSNIAGSFEFTLPITTFPGSILIGTIQIDLGKNCNSFVSDTNNNTCNFVSNDITLFASSVKFYAIFQYQI